MGLKEDDYQEIFEGYKLRVKRFFFNHWSSVSVSLNKTVWVEHSPSILEQSLSNKLSLSNFDNKTRILYPHPITKYITFKLFHSTTTLLTWNFLLSASSIEEREQNLISNISRNLFTFPYFVSYWISQIKFCCEVSVKQKVKIWFNNQLPNDKTN